MNSLQIIQSYHKALWEDKNIDAIDRYFINGAKVNSVIEHSIDLHGLKEIIQKWYAAFPDLMVCWDDFIVDDSKVVACWHAKGTHSGEFLGIEPTNTVIEYDGVTIYGLTEGKISSYRSVVDMLKVLRQLR